MAHLQQLDDDTLAVLPIFPLPKAVLFPGVALPLHIFEHRYREMIAYCLEHGSALAVAMLQPGYEADYEGRPGVFPVMGAGLIVAQERLDDGRYNILLQGTDRVRIVEEHPPRRPFRLVRAERLEDREDSDSERLANTMRALLRHLGQTSSEAGASLGKVLAAGATPGRLADLVAATVLGDPELRQRALETLDVSERLRWMTATLAERSLQDEDEAGGGGSLPS